jgi:predicted phage terminase large subunit-like protein
MAVSPLSSLWLPSGESGRTGETDFPSYGQWLRHVTPEFDWDWQHLKFIRKHLADVTNGVCRKLILSTPPQHGKSEGLTVRYPAYRLERDPGLRVAVAGYIQRHANRFSRKTRKLVRSRVSLDGTKAQNEWETAGGGSYLAVGVGSGITGMPVDLLVIDDPVKSREEADSEAFREKVWEWYMDDLTTRLQEKAAVIIVMTRWNEDDLVGRILASEDGPNWRCLNLPAIAEENDPLGREPGAPLCPERFSLATLQERQRILGEGFSGLYQGNPVPRGGLFFRRDWFGDPVGDVPDGGESVRYWDLAAAVKNTSCYTSGVRIRSVGGYYYVDDVVRGRWTPADRNGIIRQTAAADAGVPGFLRTYFEEQPGAAGKEVSEKLIADLAGYSVESDRVSGSKQTRAESLATQAKAGNVKVKAAEWTAAFLSELTSFPRGRFNDQVDSAAGAFNKLAAGGPAFVVGTY